MSTIHKQITVGVDEAARGCIFGPVAAAAVILPETWPDDRYLQIKDSKKLTKKKREELYDYICQNSVAYGIGEGSVEEIDRINILQATMKAMHRALDQVYRKQAFTHINVDGTYFTPYLAPGANDEQDPITHTTLIKGDDRERAIAAASILAKVHRDRYVENLLKEHPDLDVYGLATNMGYGTAKHIQAIKEKGLTPYHRKSFQIKSLMNS